MSLRDRIVPMVHDLVGAPMEKKPFIRGARRRCSRPRTVASSRSVPAPATTSRTTPTTFPTLMIADGMNGMLRRAEKRAEKAGRHVTVTTTPVEGLRFEDGAFDTIVASLLLCSVADQDRALAEIRRVLKPGGQYLFLEHVRSSDPKVAQSQDRWEGVWGVIAQGCHPNRDTLPRIESVFAIEELEQSELPLGPRIVRTYVLGRAIARPA